MSTATSTAPSAADASSRLQSARRIEGPWRGAFARLRKNRLAVISGIFIITIAVLAVVLPEILSVKYSDQNYNAVTQGPSWSHLMGTDDLGRDIFVRLVYGARISLTVGLVVQFVIIIIGVPLGLLAGYAGGKLDTLIMRSVDVLYAMPNLLFVILIMTFLRGTFGADPGGFAHVLAWLDGKTGGLFGVYIGLGLISWLTVARIVRVNAMSLKEKEFIEAARGLGASHAQIMFKHLLPNTMAMVVVATTLGIPSAILYEAGLSFLGLGVIPPTPSWGLMISEAIPNLRAHPYMLVFPAAALSLTVLAFNFLGDGLRDALDPWMKR
ncbi:MAG: ABC transporter permease [Thermomicrobiales bacterium]